MNEREIEKDFTAARREIERVIKEFQQLVNGEVSLDPSLEDIFEELTDIEEMWREKSFQVAVLALVKSGKSTLINALLGSECLPSSNTPETARIVRIRHEPAADEPVLEKASVKIATGVTNIRTELRSLNASQRKADSAPAEDELTLSAPILCLAGRSLGEQRFEVLDTPGPNEAGADILRTRVDGLLGKADVIIYLLDYTKLNTEEEKRLFTRLSSMRPELLKQCSERLFFVVNKIDQQDSYGLSPEETRKYVADLLSKQVGGLNVPPERVLLVSAVEGLLARIVESGQADDGVRRDFAKRVFGLGGKDKTIEQCQSAARELLNESKLEALEENIISFIYKNRERVFLQSVVERLDNFHVGFGNCLCALSESLNERIDVLAQNCRELEDNLKVTDREFAEIRSDADKVAERVKRSVQEQFSNFKDFVVQELDKAKGQKPSILKRVKDILSRDSGPVQDEKTAKEQLEAAHKTIEAELRTEFETFYDNLKQEAWKEQRKLFEGIEDKLKRLVRRTEEVVGARLNISLNPVRIEIPIPSIDEFGSQIQERIDIIQTKTDRETRQARHRVKVKDEGWCKDAQYEERQYEETREVNKYIVNHDALLEFWNARIEQMTKVSVRTADIVINREIRDATSSARSKIRRYRDLYVKTMRRSLKVAERGEAAREKRLEEVQAVSKELLKLKNTIKKCRDFLKAQT